MKNERGRWEKRVERCSDEREWEEACWNIWNRE